MKSYGAAQLSVPSTTVGYSGSLPLLAICANPVNLTSMVAPSALVSVLTGWKVPSG